MRPMTAFALAAAAAAAACAQTAAPPSAAAWTLRLETLPSPAGDASAQPQPTSSNGDVILSWLENAGSQTTLKFSRRTAGGWSEAWTIAAGDDFFANWADVPSVVRMADRTLVAHWLQRNGASASGYDLRLARSTAARSTGPRSAPADATSWWRGSPPRATRRMRSSPSPATPGARSARRFAWTCGRAGARGCRVDAGRIGGGRMDRAGE